MTNPLGESGLYTPAEEKKLLAAIDFIRRTGATNVGVRFSDDDDPTVWIAVASYGGDKHEADAALHPLRAMLRLCERLGDGGTCAHCRRPTGFMPEGEIPPQLIGMNVCWTTYDEGRASYVRACE